MAEVYKTRDPNIWFNPRNFREADGGPVLPALMALTAGQAIRLNVNNEVGTWHRFLGTPSPVGLRAGNVQIQSRWNVIPTGQWVSIELIELGDVSCPEPSAKPSTTPAVKTLGRPELECLVVEPQCDPNTVRRNIGDRVLYACDIGTTRTSNFGWTRLNLTSGCELIGSRSIDLCVKMLLADMQQSCRIALGFESPLFLPVPLDSNDLSRSRNGEGNRAWSAPPGAAVTTLGVHQSAWILRALVTGRDLGYCFTTNWHEWPGSENKLLMIWEAFISNDAHSQTNNPIEDAASAVVEFARCEKNLNDANAVTADPRISLMSAVALWAGWTNDVSQLHAPVLVLRPTSRSDCVIRTIATAS